jgi:AcrR family transcriptional regulator
VDADPARGRLSPEAIVTTAVRLIEAEGESAASMRRISAELGVAAMSLYHHVPNKSALLDAVADWVSTQIATPRLPDADWHTRARALARAFRDVAQRYPNCMQLAMSRAPLSLVGLEPLEYALEMAHEAGFTENEAIRLVRAVTSYVIGSVVTSITRTRAAQAAATMVATAAFPVNGLDLGVDPQQFPRLTALGPTLFALDLDGDFEFGLDLLLQSLRSSRPAR